MVVIFLVSTKPTGDKHERIATPSRCTVQAPHNPLPHPYLVPVRFKTSRKTHSNGVFGSISSSTDFALTDNDKCVKGDEVLALVSAVEIYARRPR